MSDIKTAIGGYLLPQAENTGAMARGVNSSRQRHVLVIEEVMNGYTVAINGQVMVVPRGGDLFAAVQEILVKSQLLEGK